MKRILPTLCSFLFSVAIFAQVSANEKQVLLDLYVATQGENWTSTWDTSEPVEHWKGITVENDHVVGIRLLFNNLDGELPASLGSLTQLRILELSFNGISGSLPESLGNLEHLEVLAFNGNNLSGSIPTSFDNLHNLKQLHLSSNKLSGTIPSSLGNLDQIEVFNVFDNKLEGAIPSGLAYQRSLRELMVAENKLTSTIDFSTALLSNSGAKLDLQQPVITPTAKTVIAIETSDDKN
jgi:hypothetical protein